MKKNKVIKCLLASVTVLAVLWIAILLCMVNKSSSISLMKNTQALPYEQKALTSMMISDTVTNIRITQGDTLKVGYEIINTGSDTLFLLILIQIVLARIIRLVRCPQLRPIL